MTLHALSMLLFEPPPFPDAPSSANLHRRGPHPLKSLMGFAVPRTKSVLRR